MVDKCWYEDVCGLKGDSCGPTCVRYAEMLNLFQMLIYLGIVGIRRSWFRVRVIESLLCILGILRMT